MRCAVVKEAVAASIAAFLGVTACAQAKPKPRVILDELTIGRQTFFDFGPPFDYFDVIQVRPQGGSLSIERVLLTPTAGCFQPAKVESEVAILHDTLPDLLGGMDPCGIKDSEIRKEQRRRKHTLVFSGANIAMRVQCTNGERTIPFDVLEQDWFEAHPNTPKYTSWSMQMLGKIDGVLGPGAMEKPIFPVLSPDSSAPRKIEADPLLTNIRNGEYDSLFPATTLKVSEIYAEAQLPPPSPTVLVESSPVQPDNYVPPVYPPIAKAARVEGVVSFHFKVGEACTPGEVTIDGGPKLVQLGIADAVKLWKFCKASPGQEIQAKLEFRLNCHDK
jgi:hypothetical protein